MRYPADLEEIGVEILASRRVPRPAEPPHEVGVGYPLAFDICGRIGAVSFAALDVYPDIAAGWWCLVELFSYAEGSWGCAGGEHDNTTTANPFTRPSDAENSNVEWVDWLSFGGAPEWDEEPRRRQSYFGVAPTRTARLTATTEDGTVRELEITPWSGAFVAVNPGTRSSLTGYDATGVELGSMSIED
jgi:hypothetical protein